MMSVQIKTPTKTRFGNSVQCGDRSFSSPDFFRRSKDDLSIKNDAKSQSWGRKRRYSQTFRRDEAAARRKRLRSAPYIGPLPSRFLNGGSIDDPLNLNGLDSSELGRTLNSVTPESSPLPTPRRNSVEVRVPLNITDPLNLNDSDEDTDLEKKLKKKKSRNRHKRKDETSLFSPPKHMNKDKNLLEALKIDVEPEQEEKEACAVKEFVKPRPVNDKIVSPVIRQDSPKAKKRRKTNSECKAEASAATARSLSLSAVSPSLKIKFDKKISPKKHKGSKTLDVKQKGQKNDKSSMKFVYGNYNRYYGYRNPCMEEDKRLKSFKKEWFEGKCVLDIGCNVGQITLSIARDFQPSKIVGMDIDANLISMARKNIRFYMSSAVTDAQKYPISCAVNYGPITAPAMNQKGASKSGFPHNVLFMQGNYVLESDELLELQKEEYDVVMALSVTKWIHFNWGDEGLKRFFKRIYRQLRPGGRFILEPQPWSSYKKKKKLTADIFENFKRIRLRPEQFTDFLLSKEIGFSTCNTIDVPYNPSKGFRRPIIVFTKSETVQNSPWSEMGSVTPVRSYQPASFGSHLSHISEDSSCSCSSYSQHSYTGDGASIAASVSNPGSVYAEDSFLNPPSLDSGSCADNASSVDHHHASAIATEKSSNVDADFHEKFSVDSGTDCNKSQTGSYFPVTIQEEDGASVPKPANQAPLMVRKRSYSDSVLDKDYSDRVFEKTEQVLGSDFPEQSAKKRKEEKEGISKDSNENVQESLFSNSEEPGKGKKS